MRKQRLARIGAATLAAVLAVQGMGFSSEVYAKEEIVRVKTDSQTQMSSEMERVAVKDYGSSAVRTQNFDSDWKFNLGDVSNAESPTFDDSKWRTLSLPHDYSIEQEYSQSLEAESGYLPGGTGWYRKNFTLGEEARGKRIRIDFDGVYMNASVYVNGKEVGTHPYGYTPFSFDITDYISYDKENTIAVKVDHQTPSSRWYSGSGIYRSVSLTTTNDVHVDLNGIKVESNNLAKEARKTVNTDVKTTVVNDSKEAQKVTVTHTVFKKGQKPDQAIGTFTTEEKEVKAGEKVEISATVPVKNPELWSVENPALYTVRTEVKAGDKLLDICDTEYGFRYLNFDTETGFQLNGKNVKLKGVCMHHDQGALGAVANRRAIERQVEILQEMGCNSIRVTHNPASKDLIEICNEKGILVIEEVFDGWHRAKNGNSNDYSVWFEKAIEENNTILGKEEGMTWAEYDLKAIMKRDQNAPSVIEWSLGNEIQEGAGGTGYAERADKLIKWAKEVDAMKTLTIGSNAVKRGDSEQISIGDKLTKAGGTSGTNYSDGTSYDKLHKEHKDWKLYGSETASSINSRGVYSVTGNQEATSDQQLTSYDNSKVNWGALASEAWYDVIQRDFVAGEYVWTGFDYIGEPTPWNGTDPGAKGTWPSPKNSYFGIIDTAGFPKDSYYFYQSQWNDEVNTLHVLPAWNEDVVKKNADGTVPVVVYSDAKEVELFFTPADEGEKKSLGKKTFKTEKTDAGYTYQVLENGKKNHKDLYMEWQVPYEAGTLEAVAKDAKGNVIKDTKGRSAVKTTGDEAKLSAKADRKSIQADGKDLSYVTVDVTDKNGNIVPDAANCVTFDVQGAGKLVGVDNGSSPDHDSYKADNRKAFSGKVLAIVQSTEKAGEITVTAKADGLESSTVKITTTPVKEESTERYIESYKYSKSYYVKTGIKPQLPEKIEAQYSDGTKEDLAVKWGEISDEQVSETGSFPIEGTVGKRKITVNINMIDDVAALLNYSGVTQKDVKPQLPDVRPAVLPDGTVLSASFPVQWEEVDANAFQKPDEIVTVNGSADVFGKTIPVIASIRVQKEDIKIASSVTNVAKLSQNIQGSDTLEAIKDGKTEMSLNNDGGPNETAWSNWDAAQKGTKEAELTFTFDTQQRIGEIVIHFAKDNSSIRFPDAGTTEIFVSETGKDGSWEKIEAKEHIGKEKDRVKAYRYEMASVTATYVKVKVVNANATDTGNRKPCTAITEVELKKAEGSFKVNETAELAEVKVGERVLPEAAYALDSYSVPETDVEVTAKAKDNASLTILPKQDNVVRMILESEDHKATKNFAVRMGEEETVLPNDDSRDYPVEKTTATAGSEYAPGTANEGPVKYVLDGKANTHWHTNWGTGEGGKLEHRTITLKLGSDEEEAPVIEALRYLPRNNGANGRVTEYKIEYSMDGNEWQTAGTGTLDKKQTDWAILSFKESVQAKYVRLIGIHTASDSGADKDMAVAELRARVSAKAPVPSEKYTITATVNDEKMGEVKLDSETGEYEKGAKATLTAKAKEGFTFVNWTIDGKEVSKENPYVHTMEADVVITANFKPAVIAEKFTFTANVNDKTMGSVAVKPEQEEYEEGTEITVTATPVSEDFEFVSFTKGDTTEVVSYDSTYKFNIAENTVLTANFREAANTCVIYTDVNDKTMGSVSIQPEVAGNIYKKGTEITVTATPAEGSEFVQWLEVTIGEDGKEITTPVKDAKEIYTFTAEQNRTLRAEFKTALEEGEYRVAVRTNDEAMGEAVLDHENGIYAEGEEATATATAKKGFEFVNWTETENGEEVSKDAVYKFIVNAHMDITANFKKTETELPLTAEDVLNDLSEGGKVPSEIKKDETSFTLPEVPEGFKLEIEKVDPEGVIGLDGSVVTPEKDTEVIVTLKVTAPDGTSRSGQFKVKVEGKNELEPNPNPNPKPDPEPNPNPDLKPEPKPEPPKPDNGNQGGTNKPSTNTGSKPTNKPSSSTSFPAKTGDYAPIAMWGGLFGISAAAILVLLKKARKQK